MRNKVNCNKHAPQKYMYQFSRWINFHSIIHYMKSAIMIAQQPNSSHQPMHRLFSTHTQSSSSSPCLFFFCVPLGCCDIGNGNSVTRDTIYREWIYFEHSFIWEVRSVQDYFFFSLRIEPKEIGKTKKKKKKMKWMLRSMNIECLWIPYRVLYTLYRDV